MLFYGYKRMKLRTAITHVRKPTKLYSFLLSLWTYRYSILIVCKT